MSTGRLVFKNFISLTFSNSISKVAGLFTVVYLARILGPGDFGSMNFALSLVSYFAILAHLGLGTLGIRELAQRTGDQSAYINSMVSIKILLGVAAFALLGALVFFMPQTADLKRLTLLYGLTIFTSNVLTFDWVYQGIEKMEYLGAASVIQSLVYMAAIFLQVRSSADLPAIPLILLAAQGASVLFLFIAYRRLTPGYAFKFAPDLSSEVFQQALPIAVWGVMTIITLNSGVTILGFLKGTEEVGYFSAAYKLVWIFVETLIAYAYAVFPTISKHYAQNPEAFRKVMDGTLKWTAIVSVPAITGILMLSGPIIALIYGNKFHEAGLLLKITAVLPYLIFMNNIFSMTLLAAHRQKKTLYISCFQAALSVGLGFLLIRFYGAVGLAASAVISHTVTNAVYLVQTRGIYAVPVKLYVKPLAASLLMAAVLTVMSGGGLPLLIAAGAAVYTAAILLIKGVDREDLAQLSRIVSFGRGAGGAR